MSERPSHTRPESRTVDVFERGLPRDGVPQRMDRRLFVKLAALRADTPRRHENAVPAAITAAEEVGASLVVYADAHDPRTLAFVTFAEDADLLLGWDRRIHGVHELDVYVPRPELAMLGRTYSSGYESDLEYWLLRRPVETLLHAGWDWGIYYPLRRKGEFNRLPREEQGAILREHGEIGRAYGDQNLAHDLRLACHGLDVNDNDFIIGLIGESLHPLSHVVQSMRGTRQTGEFMDQMGPFFVGRVLARTSPSAGGADRGGQ